MKRNRMTILAVAGAMAVWTTGTAAASAPREYRVDVVMREDGKTVGSPSLTAQAGAPATVMIGNASYLLKLVATTGTDARVALRSETALWTPEGLAHDGADHALAADGAPASFAFTRTDPATRKESRIDVEVRVHPLSD